MWRHVLAAARDSLLSSLEYSMPIAANPYPGRNGRRLENNYARPRRIHENRLFLGNSDIVFTGMLNHKVSLGSRVAIWVQKRWVRAQQKMAEFVGEDLAGCADVRNEARIDCNCVQLGRRETPQERIIEEPDEDDVVISP
jgi:hypothetical protein